MKASTVKYIFYGIALFIFIGFIYTNVVGKTQDETYKQDFAKYQQAMQHMQNNQPDQAANILEVLIKKYSDEYMLYYQLGLALTAQQDYEKAAIQYQKAIDIRPALLQNQTFTFRIGESLYHINQFEPAKAYLLMPVPEQFQPQKDELLQLIEKKIQS